MSHLFFLLSSFMAPLALFLFLTNKILILNWTFFSNQTMNLSLPIIIDLYGCLFSLTVLFISANVSLFSSSYMSEDKFVPRFTIFVSLFILSMNLLIFIPNLITLLIGWDGLGITSFILVIYYQNPKSLAAGMLTLLMNRVGDIMIIISILFLFNIGHWSILSIWKDDFSPFVWLALMISAMTKSAQLPFSSWLPAAMAAPTPVSALVHSSTLVTAGVFLIFRFHYFLSLFPYFNKALLIIASMTMFMAGISALNECDMKKIIALSTLSQLSVMMTSLSLNLPTLAFFHLITHALFKALLFLAAGSVIHFNHHSQDLRFMGNLIFSSPLTLAALTTANLSLAGSPFLAGFYSKDLILEFSLMNPANMLALLLISLSTILTSSYAIRFMILLTWGPSSSSPFLYLSDKDTNMTTPMIFLSLCAISMGFILNWLLFNKSLEPSLPLSLKLMPLIFMISGAALGIIFSISSTNGPIFAPYKFFFITSMYFLYPLSTQMMIIPSLKFASNLNKILDKGWLELLGPSGLIYMLNNTSNSFSSKLLVSPMSMFLVSLSSIFFMYL